MKNISFILIVLLPLIWLTCQSEEASPLDETPYEWEVPAGFPAPVDSEENPTTLAKVELGKQLFYDPILSRDSSVSCNSCHKQELAFADDRPISPGVEGRLGLRNAPTLANVAYVTRFNKDGGVPKLDMQAGVPIEDENEMDMLMRIAAERLNAVPAYQEAFQRAFARPADAFTITRALAAFQRTFISGDSRFDQYEYQGESTALNEAELRGRALFFSDRTQCSSCHSSFNFTNNEFINNGLYLDYGDDPGRQRVTISTDDEGKFRVPTLRNVGLTAPYMHDGSLADLAAVIDHYNQGGQGHPLQDARIQPLNLSDTEKNDLIAFLHSLTDASFLSNPAYRQ